MYTMEEFIELLPIFFTEEELKTTRYSVKQLYEMMSGLENGLTKDQVGLYANPKLNWQQMREIRIKLEKENCK